MTDPELVQNLIKKDENSYKILIDRYQALVYKACYNMLKNSQDAEDIAQEVFLELFESIAMFRNESKLSTWLYRIAINKSLNHLRKNKWKSMVNSIENFFGANNKNSNLEIEDENALNAPGSLEYSERALVLKNALDQLPENQRIAFTLCKYDELSYQEISEVMNLSVSSIESLIHRAKTGLQKKLVNYYKN